MNGSPTFLPEEKALREAFNALPKDRRALLLGNLSFRLADDLGADSNDRHRWFLISMEGGNDTTMWGEDLEAEYEREPFSAVEELAFALYGVSNLAMSAWLEMPLAKA